MVDIWLFDIWGFPKMGVPQKWMVYKGKSHTNGWWLGVPLFVETTIWPYINHVNEAYIPFINHQSPSLIIYQSYGFIDDGMKGYLMGLEYNLVSNHEFKNHEWE